MGLLVDERASGLGRVEGDREDRSSQVQLLHLRVRPGPRQAREEDRLPGKYNSNLLARQ